MSLGERIMGLRTARKLSQEELADMLGVSRQSVSKWETDASVPDLDKLVRLGEIFDISLDALVKGENLTAAAVEETSAEGKAPEAEERKPAGNRQAGYVYLIIGAAITILLGLYAGFLAGLIFGLPFYVCAIICLTSKGRRTGIWCGWAMFFLVDLYLRYATGLTWTTIFWTLQWTPQQNYTRLVIAWCQFLVGVFFILWTVFACGRTPWEAEKDWKPPIVVGIVGVACCTFLMGTMTKIIAQNHFFSGPIYTAFFLWMAAMDYCRMALVARMGTVACRVWRMHRTENKN